MPYTVGTVECGERKTKLIKFAVMKFAVMKFAVMKFA